MIIKRNKRILYLHGKDEEIKYGPENSINYKTLNKYFDVDFLNYPTYDIKASYELIKNINMKKYNLVFGFSLGGVYGSIVDTDKPIILLNPGFGVSMKFPEFKFLENERKKINKNNTLILQSSDDKYFDVFHKIELKEYGKDKIKLIPNAKHVLTEEEIIKYVIPEITTIL